MHLFACFWYLSAKFRDLNESTWVARRDAAEYTIVYKYILAIYWALQTITTVGYGDFGSGDVTELCITTVWMVMGVAFYSFTVGSISSTIASSASSIDDLEAKLKALDDFKKTMGLPDELFIKIRQYLLNNYRTIYNNIAEEELLNELPMDLKDAVIYQEFGKVVETISILKNC